MKKNVDVYVLTRQTTKFIEREQQLLERRVSHPELFINYVRPLSDLHWGNKFPKRCLIELITALHIVGAVTDKFGKAIDFKPLAETFGRVFNVDLSLAYKERVSLMSRTNKAAFFLSILKERLLEKSREKSKN